MRPGHLGENIRHSIRDLVILQTRQNVVLNRLLQPERDALIVFRMRCRELLLNLGDERGQAAAV